MGKDGVSSTHLLDDDDATRHIQWRSGRFPTSRGDMVEMKPLHGPMAGRDWDEMFADRGAMVCYAIPSGSQADDRVHRIAVLRYRH
jgi:hypothetical protein